MALTKKRQAFCKFYSTPFSETFGNGLQSALKAGYSKNTAKNEASRMLAMQDVKDECSRIEAESYKASDWTIEKFRAELEKCYNAVEANSPNKAKYLEMIAKVKRFFEADNQTNILIFNGSDAKTIAEQVKAVRDRVRSGQDKRISASERQKPSEQAELIESGDVEPVFTPLPDNNKGS